MYVAENRPHFQLAGQYVDALVVLGSQFDEHVTAPGIGFLFVSVNWITHCPRGPAQSVLLTQYLWQLSWVPSPMHT